MDDDAQLTAASHDIATAIASRDVETLSRYLAPSFVYRTPGGDTLSSDAFLASVRQIPGEILFVRVRDLEIDIEADAAIVSGIQHAQVRVEGSALDDVRSFVDFFVRREGRWMLRAAVGLPAPEVPPGEPD
jgi:hypothetical protein